jgi:VWFA-related protein
MRRLILLGLLAAMVLPAGATKLVTVAQLEQELAADSAAHRSDTDVSLRLGVLKLTERLTDTGLKRMTAKVVLGPKTALTLRLLADQSLFLEPPASELPAVAAPDAATQQHTLQQARAYVTQILPRLPDFFATRTTYRFDDSQQLLVENGWPVRAGLHPVGVSTREITFRDDHEVVAPPKPAEKVSKVMPGAQPAQQEEVGLRTWGEFGPTLAFVLFDTLKGSVTFSHWEQASQGSLAVYRYSVPKAASHYILDYCCIRDQSVGARSGGRGRRGGGGGQLTNQPDPDAKSFHETPAYHGSLSIDPATGAVLRVTVEADLNDRGPVAQAAAAIEYGPVTIGGRTYICPVRSLASSLEQPSSSPRPGESPVLVVNETSFTDYHRLGSTIRMVSNAEAASSNAGAPNPGTPASVPPGSAPAGLGAQPTPAEVQLAGNAPPPAPAEAAPAEPASSAPASMPPPAPAESATPEVTVTAAYGVPDEPGQPQQDSFLLKAASRLVDVPLVAYDKKGHPVKNLTPEDFEVYDNQHRQEVLFLSQSSDQMPSAPASATPGATFSNRPGSRVAAATAEGSATILLLDGSHLSWPDLSHARQDLLKFFGALAPGERVGLYAMAGPGFRVLQEITTDRAALVDSLQKWMPTEQSWSQAQAAEMHNAPGVNPANGNRTETPASSAADPQQHALGREQAHASLVVLAGVARHLSFVPGHKNLVWISSERVFAGWQRQAAAPDASPKFADTFALQAQEAMNDAHVAVYPFDVSRSDSGGFSGGGRRRSGEPTENSLDNAAFGAPTPRDMTQSRGGDDPRKETHPIQAAIQQVTDATGGRVIRRSDDLPAALSGIVEDGHATYLLSFSPQGPADDQFHSIAVLLTGKQKGLVLRYRTGYLFAKEPATLKDRFQQAIWRSRELSEISVTATASPTNDGANIKVGILAGDLGLRQQNGLWLDKVDVFFIQRDDAGLHALIDGQSLNLRLEPSTYQKLQTAGIPVEHGVQWEPGMASLRIVVVDENSGRMGSVTLPASALGAVQ